MKARIFLTTCIFYFSTAHTHNEIKIYQQHEKTSNKSHTISSEKPVVQEPTNTTFRDWKKEVYALYDSISTDYIQKYINERLTPTPIRLKWHITKKSSAEFEQIESELMKLALSTDMMMKYIYDALTDGPIKLNLYRTLFTDWEVDDYWNRSTTPLGQTFRTNPFIDRLLFKTAKTKTVEPMETTNSPQFDSKERTLNVWEKMERIYRRKLTKVSPTQEKETPQTMITSSNTVDKTLNVRQRIRELHSSRIAKLITENGDSPPKGSGNFDRMSILFQKMMRINNAYEQLSGNSTQSTYRDWKKEVYALYDSISTDHIQKYINERWTHTPIRLNWHITKKSSAEFEQIESELMQLALSTNLMMKLVHESFTNHSPIKLNLYNTRFTDWEVDDYWHRSTTPLGQTFRTNPYIDRLLNKTGKTKNVRSRATIITRKVDSKERTLNVWEKMEKLYERRLTTVSPTHEKDATHNTQSSRVKRSLDKTSQGLGKSLSQNQTVKTKKRSETDEMFNSMMEAEEEQFSKKKLKKLYNFKRGIIGELVNEFRAKGDIEKLELKQGNASWEKMYTLRTVDKKEMSYDSDDASEKARESLENFLAQGKTPMGTPSHRKFDKIINKQFDAFEKRYAENPLYQQLMNGIGWEWDNLTTKKDPNDFVVYPGGVLFTMKTNQYDRLDSPKTKRPAWLKARKITCQAFLGLLKSFNAEDRKVAEEAYFDLPSGESSEPRDLSKIDIMITERWGAKRNITNSLLLHAMRYMKDDEIVKLKEDYQLYPPF